MSDKERVLQRCRLGIRTKNEPNKCTVYGLDKSGNYRRIGSGPTEEAALADAARNLESNND